MYPPYPPDQGQQGQSPYPGQAPSQGYPSYPQNQGQQGQSPYPGQAPSQGYPSYPATQAPQGYPYGSSYGQMPPVPQPPAGLPTPVKAAGVLMFIGAALEIIGAIVALSGSGSGKGSAAVGALIGAGLWIWMAVKNRQGRNWARITGTVFFALDTIALIVIIAMGNAAESAAGSIGWALGLVTVILLWQRSSSAYFSGGGAYNTNYPNYPAQGGW